MRTLTREQARERAALLQVASYDVWLDLTGGDETFLSVVEVRFTATAAARSFLELDGALLEGDLDGRPLSLHGSRIPLDLTPGEHVARVRARCAYSRTGEGLHRFRDPVDGHEYVWAQAFLDDCQRIVACFDQPDLKAAWRVTVQVPPGWTVVAGGGGGGRQDGTRFTSGWTPPLPTYLFHVSAGPWHRVQEHDPASGLLLGLWCRQSLAPHLDAAELLDVTRRALAHETAVYGRPYPFGERYDQLFVPEFNHGAMENPGSVTFSEDFLPRGPVTSAWRRERAQVVAHEMAHMWFGDLVTMRWWDDLWLNESFAEMQGTEVVDRATPFTGGWTAFAAGRKAWGYRADAAPTTHPVSGPVADTRSALLSFDGISYAKGASALRQLTAALGSQAFEQGVRAYLATHAHGSTTLADLLAALAEAAGRDLQPWAASWLEQAGTTRITASVTDGEVVLTPSDDRPHRVAVASYAPSGGRLMRSERVEVDLVGVPVRTGLAARGLVLPNDGDLTFAALRLDPASHELALSRLADVGDGLARVLVAQALWDMVREAELTPSAYVQACLPLVGVEVDAGVLEPLLWRLGLAAGRYCAPSRLGQVAAACDVLARRSDGDRQRAAVHGLLATTPDPAPALALLRGVDVPAGLVVDPDLRWEAAVRASALGALDEAALAAELARDATATGQREAARALAARPDPATKAAVWEELTGEAPPAGARARALAAAFWQPGQEELLAPYAGRYAAEVEALWGRRSPQVATTTARGLFPSLPGVPLGDLPEPAEAGLARVLREEGDERRRALAARALDAAAS